jgi:2-oxoisovalerate dehydrogenase E1 component
VLDAAHALAQGSVDVSVVDLRWLRPLDDEALAKAVRDSGGRVLVVHEAHQFAGFGAEIASLIGERHFADLTLPVRRLGAIDVRIPSAPILQESVLPTPSLIEATVRSMTDAVAVSRS